MSSSPHNDLFLQTFSNPSRAAAHLRTLVPPALANSALWSEMRLAPSEFASVGQGSRRSDLLFELPLSSEQRSDSAEQSPSSMLLYVLFEHQSTVDRTMAVRMLIYMALTWDTWLRERSGSAGALPFIYPLVLYHGSERWTAKTQFSDLFRGPHEIVEALLPFTPAFRYQLEDLRRDAAPSVGDPIAQAVLNVFSSREFDGALLALRRAFDSLDARSHHDEDMKAAYTSLVVYVLLAFEDSDTEALRQALDRPGTPAGDIIMTGGQQLIEQGIEQGIEQATRTMVARLLALGVDTDTIAHAAGLDVATIDRIRATDVSQ